MDTNRQKTPVPLTLADWRALAPTEAAREVHARVAALSDPLRRAAVAWLRPERDLAEDLERWNGLSSRRSERVEDNALHPLRGVPYFLKDLFDVAGLPTGAGSTFLAAVRPTPGDSAIVRLLRARGAVLAGKTHLVEFASGLTGENPHFGDCPHPLFPGRLTGGSSSGSAALVAAGVTPLAIGTDTGGSVRVPAAFCGLYGFRLTPGDELVRDAFPLAPTMDTAGWFTANAADMLTAAQALIDLPAATGKPRGCYLPGRSLVDGIDRAIDAACEKAAARLAARADAATEAALLDSWREAVDAYLTIGMSEAHAVHQNWLAPYRDQYDPVIWQRFSDAGRYPVEKVAAARAAMARVRAVWAQFFQTHDFLVLPSAPCAAPTKAECTPELRRRIIALTAPASLGGLPCLSLPVSLGGGFTAGLQVIARAPRSPAFAWVLKQ
jgi:Asp-tRNA(Asn)/Glu-tRNA(Gln) amidotransferase A subunit family amidase